MVSVALPRPARPDRDDADGPVRGRRPAPLPHPPEAMDGIPYYDDELAMAQSDAHRLTIMFLGTLLDRVAKAAGLRGVSDYPVWYWLPEQGVQRALYPDYAVTASPSIATLTAHELLLALEVVSTAQPVKEEKDTVVMRARNAAHGVREFVLVYPEPDDPRSVVWQRYDERTGRYREVPLSADGYYRSMAIPGLAMEVLPPAAWTAGRKVRVWFRGEEVRDGETEARVRAAAEQQARAERLGREAAEQQASEAEERAARECARANRECAEKERLLDLLKQAGIDPGV